MNELRHTKGSGQGHTKGQGEHCIQCARISVEQTILPEAVAFFEILLPY